MATLTKVTQLGNGRPITQILISLLSSYSILSPPPSITHTVQRSRIFNLLNISGIFLCDQILTQILSRPRCGHISGYSLEQRGEKPKGEPGALLEWQVCAGPRNEGRERAKLTSELWVEVTQDSLRGVGEGCQSCH